MSLQRALHEATAQPSTRTRTHAGGHPSTGHRLPTTRNLKTLIPIQCCTHLVPARQPAHRQLGPEANSDCVTGRIKERRCIKLHQTGIIREIQHSQIYTTSSAAALSAIPPSLSHVTSVPEFPGVLVARDEERHGNPVTVQTHTSISARGGVRGTRLLPRGGTYPGRRV